MAYQLKTVDLTRHVRTEAGVRHFHEPIGSPIGKHLTASPTLEGAALDVGGVRFEEHVKRLEDLMKKVQNNDTSLTVDENAWTEVADRLDAMTKITKAKMEHLSVEKRQAIKVATGAAAGAGLRYAIKHHVPSKIVKVGKEWVNESSGAARDSAIHSVTVWATNFAASASGLIGLKESGHFIEAFNHLLENPAIEVGFTATAAVLISAFISRIRKALRARKDRKIAEARGLTLK